MIVPQSSKNYARASTCAAPMDIDLQKESESKCHIEFELTRKLAY